MKYRIVNKRRFTVACIVVAIVVCAFFYGVYKLNAFIDSIYADKLMDAYKQMMGW